MTLAKKFHTLNELTKSRLIVAFISLLISLTMIISDDIINADGILYVNMAQTYLDNGFSEMASLYNWPFFALLMVSITKLLGTHAETSAYLLNIIFFVLLTDALVRICANMLPSTRQTAIAAILILSFYTLNEYRNFVIRDIGYWAFIFLGILAFFRFNINHKLKHLLHWQVYTLIAILFRIEGVVILVLMPLYLLTDKSNLHRLKAFMFCYSLPLIATVITSFIFLWYSGIANAFNKVENIWHYADFDRIQSHYLNDLDTIANAVINPIATDQAALLLNSGLIGMVVYEIIAGLSVSIIGLYLLSRNTPITYTDKSQKILLFLLLINFLILTAFVYNNQFITTRYCITAIVALLLIILPRICSYLDSAITEKNGRILLIATVLVTLSIIDTYHHTSSKTYIKEAAIESAHRLPASSKIVTNDYFAQYYMQQSDESLNVKRFDEYTDGDVSYFFIVEKSDKDLLNKIKNKFHLNMVLQKTEGNYTATLYQVQN